MMMGTYTDYVRTLLVKHFIVVQVSAFLWYSKPFTKGIQRPDLMARLLERAVVPLFYTNRPAFIEVMRHAIALNGSFFNTQRMVAQYAAKAYLG